MEKANRKIKYLLLVGASILCVSTTKEPYKYHPNYEILDNYKAYAKYSNGYVYIGDEEYLKGIKFKPGDVLVLDEREEKKNIKIINSYLITDKETQNDILNIILAYENEYPSSWERSIETMREEWKVHNVLYGLNIRKSSTTDVDFENNEEKVYKLLAK